MRYGVRCVTAVSDGCSPPVGVGGLMRWILVHGERTVCCATCGCLTRKIWCIFQVATPLRVTKSNFCNFRLVVTISAGLQTHTIWSLGHMDHIPDRFSTCLYTIPNLRSRQISDFFRTLLICSSTAETSHARPRADPTALLPPGSPVRTLGPTLRRLPPLQGSSSLHSRWHRPLPRPRLRP